MNELDFGVDRLERAAVRRLAPHREALERRSVDLLRMSLGLVFLLFGVLKFVPGLSPAEELVTLTVTRLSFGLVPEGAGIVAVATMETAIGLCLLTGRAVRLGLGLLGVAMAGVLSPLVLLTDQLFAGPYHAPTLAAQYVFKDLVLLAAGLVVATRVLAQHPVATGEADRSFEHEARGGHPLLHTHRA